MFLHWRVPAEDIQALLPTGLTVDTFEGEAWVGLVPFKMRRIRPWWSPSIPGISNFYETNVRTYVHYRGKDPGVWFFSLDASSRLAVSIARWKWSLNYFLASMHGTRQENILRYASRRPNRRPYPGDSQVEVLLPDPGMESRFRPAEPHTLEHFLVERYLLYAFDRRSQVLRRGQVHHPAYRYCSVDLLKCDQTLVASNAIPVETPPESVLYCPGVDVEIFPLAAF